MRDDVCLNNLSTPKPDRQGRAIYHPMLSLLAIFGIAALPAQAEIEYLSSCLWSGAHAVVVEEGLAYCASPSGLEILDISGGTGPVPDVLMPTVIGRLWCPGSVEPSHFDFGWIYPPGTIMPRDFQGGDLCKQGNYVFYARGSAGLLVIDVSDPFQPWVMSQIDVPGHAIQVMVEDNLGLLLGANNQLSMIDVSEPSRPQLVYTDSLPYDASSIFFDGNLAYVASPSDSGRIEILDVTQGDNPRLIGRCEGLPADDLFVVDTLIYVVGRDYVNYRAGQFTVINASDPTSPTPVGSLVAAADHVVVSGSTAYLLRHWTDIDGSFGTSLYGVDISDPANPVGEGSLLHIPKGAASSMVVWDGIGFFYGFVADAWHGLQIVDVHSPADPFPLHTSELIPLQDVLAADNLLLAWGAGLIHLLDISERSAPCYLEQIDLDYPEYGSPECDVYVDGGLLYVADQGNEPGLRIYDLSVPVCPHLLSHYAGYVGNRVRVLNGLAYVGRSDGLGVIDVSNPESPLLIGQYEHEGGPLFPCRDLQVDDSLVYLYTSYRLEIYNVIDPCYPVLLGTYDHGGAFFVSRGFSVVNGLALASWNMTDVAVIDVADPFNPTLITTFEKHMSSPLYDIATRDTLAFLGVDGGGIEVWSIADPMAPRFIEHYDTPDAARGVFSLDSLIFVADFTSVQVLKASTDGPVTVGDDTIATALPSSCRLFQNYPNPFNPVTTLEYILPRRSHVSIDVLNVLGQKVRTLVDCVESAGSHSVRWDGTDAAGTAAATGVYLCRFQAEAHVETKKMLLLR